MWFQSSTMAPLQMARPPTSEAFLGHLSLWNEVRNVLRMKGLALMFPVRKCWKLPPFTNPSSGGPDEWPRSLLLPPLLNLLKVGNFQYFLTRSFLVQFDFFTAFLETSKRALSFWKHSRPHFTMTYGPKRPQKLAAVPSVAAVPL